jgi:hypothetical protein
VTLAPPVDFPPAPRRLFDGEPQATYDPAVATYRQPRALNLVSATLLLVAAALGYVGYAAWPLVALNADLKNVVEDAVPRLYRANLLPEPESSQSAEQLRQAVVEQLTRLGIENAESALSLSRDEHRVAVALRIRRALDLKLIHYSIPITLHPSAATSAARVSD